MDTLQTIIQLIIAFGILNVWILRFNKPTRFRGGDAKTMKEEFSIYGLPGWFMALIGALKLLFAVMLIIGVWVSGLTVPAASGLAVLMAGAVGMHIRIGDPLEKTTPALIVLALCLFVALF